MAFDYEEIYAGVRCVASPVFNYTGDVVAHTLCSGARQARRFVGRELCRSQRQVAEYLTEEARLAPGPLEVASFNDDVEELAQQMKAIELRLARLEQQVS